MLTRLTCLAISLTAFVGCTTPSSMSGDDDPGVDAPGDDAPAWTNGTSTLSGAREAGYLDGIRGRARLNNPVNVLVHDDVIYVADFDNNKVCMVATDGTTTTLVAQPDFGRPFAMTFGGDGRLYVTTDRATNGTLDAMSGTIWRVDLPSCTASVVAARIGRPRGLAWFGGKLAVSDFTHHVIQLVDPTSGVVTPYAGTWDAPGMADGMGATARFASPYGLAVDLDGRLLVADYENNRIRAIGSDGLVATLAGAGTAGFSDGAMTAAQFHRPQGLSIDQAGEIFITDIDNFRVRRISGSTVETVAGSGVSGYLDSDDNLAAQFYGLEGLSVSPDGKKLYVADGTRGEDRPFNTVRVVNLH